MMPISVVLPGAVGSEQRENLAGLHVEIDVLERPETGRIGL